MAESLKNIDEMIEVWDWEKAVPTGKAVQRTRAHIEGIAHEGVHLWVIRTIKRYPELLFQHRAKNKKTYPDCLDITVGGHVPFGKSEKKIQKESNEEIGINPDDDDLIDLGYYRYEEIDDAMIHREFQRVYLVVDNRPLDKYSFNDGEVEGIHAVPLEYLEQMLIRDFSFLVDGYNGKSISIKEISRKNFHPLLFSQTMAEYMKIVIKGVKKVVRNEFVTVKMPSPI